MMSGGLPVAQAILGHRDIGTTADIYGHLTAVHLAKSLAGNLATEEDAKKRPAEKLDETGRKTLFLAEKFRNHHNPEVALLTGLCLQNLSQFASGANLGKNFCPVLF